MKEYTLETLLPHFRAIVADKGEDYVYEPIRKGTHLTDGCFYHNEGQPSCGVGHVLHRIGVPIEALKLMDEGFETSIGDQYSRLAQDHSITFDIGAKSLMESFQDDQDNAISWGDALKASILWAEKVQRL